MHVPTLLSCSVPHCALCHAYVKPLHTCIAHCALCHACAKPHHTCIAPAAHLAPGRAGQLSSPQGHLASMAPPEENGGNAEPTLVESSPPFAETALLRTPPRKTLSFGELVEGLAGALPDAQGHEASVGAADEMLRKLQSEALLASPSSQPKPTGKGRGCQMKGKQEEIVKKLKEAAEGFEAKSAQLYKPLQHHLNICRHRTL